MMVLSSVLLNPRKIWRIIEILLHSRGKANLFGMPGYELLSIAVLKDYRGQGVADKLYARLAGYFCARSAYGFLIAIGEGLKPAHSFYVRMGARSVKEILVHGSEKSVVYVHDLNQAIKPD